MRTLIVCNSKHRGNTRKVAEAFAWVLDAAVEETRDVGAGEIREYDLVGFGSGIYGGKHEEDLLRFIDQLPFGNDQKVFIFSTSAKGNKNMEEYHWSLRDKLLAKSYRVLGEFCCKGSVLPEAWRLIGAHSRIRPNAAELEEARYFAAKVGNKAQRR